MDIVIKIPKCPMCGELDDVTIFTFFRNFSTIGGLNEEDRLYTILSDKNPTDIKYLFICPHLHVFDQDGEMFNENI